MENLAQIILLLAVAVAVVLIFQRLRVPTSLGYLLVGVILGPHTIGPTVYVPEFKALAEFGVVFLLFTIGLNFSLPQLHALRHQVLGLGTGQVVFTTLAVAIALWLAGLPAAAAFHRRLKVWARKLPLLSTCPGIQPRHFIAYLSISSYMRIMPQDIGQIFSI